MTSTCQRPVRVGTPSSAISRLTLPSTRSCFFHTRSSHCTFLFIIAHAPGTSSGLKGVPITHQMTAYISIPHRPFRVTRRCKVNPSKTRLPDGVSQ